MPGLLNIGEMGALALHVMVELSLQRETNPDARTPVTELAEKMHASVHTAQKVARRLIQSGLVDGSRGASGGLRLARDPESISMLQIIESVDGPIRCNGCLFANRVCPAGERCAFEQLTGGLEGMIRNHFTTTSLADLCGMTAQPQ